MPTSECIRALRARIDATVLEIPAVNIITFEARKRLLLVRHGEGNDRTAPAA